MDGLPTVRGVCLEKVLYWFRSDLRLNDNSVLKDALACNQSLSFLFVHDPRARHTSLAGIPRTGWHRRRFLKQSLEDLRRQLKELGFELLEIWGEPEEVIPELMEFNDVGLLYFSRESAPEEIRIESLLRNNLAQKSRSTVEGWTQFLLDPDELGVLSKKLPRVFTDFRKQIESRGLENLVSAPHTLHRELVKARPFALKWANQTSFKNITGALRSSVQSVDENWWHPTLEEEQLCLTAAIGNIPDAKSKIIKGGSSAAEEHLDHYLFSTRAAFRYFDTRNGLLSGFDSTLFSPWLANGCLSPRRIFHELKKAESIHGANKSTYWIVFELLWRDFFKHHLLNSGERFFHPEGLSGRQEKEVPTVEAVKEKLAEALSCRSGHVFADANIRELILTGFMSNRGRQNVASHMIYSMGIPWWMGAAVFEALLVDYDAASNWGNWSYIAGVSFDPRGGRQFNLDKQQRDYDPDGEYVSAWSNRI